jgi:hypothetical protein
MIAPTMVDPSMSVKLTSLSCLEMFYALKMYFITLRIEAGLRFGQDGRA